MRILVLASFVLFAMLHPAAASDDGWQLHQNKSRLPFSRPLASAGLGPAASGAGAQANYITSQGLGGWLERRIPLESWRDHRLRVSLRVKTEGEARSGSFFSVIDADGNSLAAPIQKNDDIAAGNWQTHQFVVDVPKNAANLAIRVGLDGKGTVWVEGLRLEVAGSDVATSDTRRVIVTAPPACVARPPYEPTALNCNSVF